MIDRKIFFDAVRAAPFPGRLNSIQVNGLSRILDYWDAHRPDGALDTWLAYILATAFHETSHIMQPIEEYGKGTGKPYGPTGYYGRGLVQITWAENYAKFERRGIDGLVAHPERALEWDVALKILFDGMVEGLFTGHKLADYFTPKASDPVNARRIVNALDKAAQIATYYTAFARAIGDAQGAAPATEPPPVEAPPIEPAPAEPPPLSDADKLNQAEIERHRTQQEPSLADVLAKLCEISDTLKAIQRAVEGDRRAAMEEATEV